MKKYDISSTGLHILAMLCMLLDHLWATVVPGNDWMTCVGRLAFPIFAFLIVEGYFYTKNVEKYMLRLLLCAVISEIPFNLMCSGSLSYPFHQNVLWSFLISLALIRWNDRLPKSKPWRRALRLAVTVIAGFLLATVAMVDYYGYGVLMVLLFWFFRGRLWWQVLGQVLGLYWINWEMMGGRVYEFALQGRALVIPQQGFALLAMIPILMYTGRKGNKSKAFQLFCYLFYPAHMLLLYLLG